MNHSMLISRNRVSLLLCIVVVIALGLASRKFTFLFPPIFGKYPGAVLWGLMLYFVIAFVKKDKLSAHIAIWTFIVSSAVEFSQLIQLSWLNDIRHTVIGHLILGTVFSWYDLLAYMVGIGIGFMLDKITFERYA